MQAAPQRIDLFARTPFLDEALAACRAGEREFDLSALAQFDSSAVAILVAIQREAGERPARFLNAPTNLRKLAVLYGVDALLFDDAGNKGVDAQR